MSRGSIKGSSSKLHAHALVACAFAALALCALALAGCNSAELPNTTVASVAEAVGTKAASSSSASSQADEQAAAEEAARKAAEKLKQEHENATFAAQVQEMLQFPDYPGGCEVVALACVLNAMGNDVDAGRITDDFLKFDDVGGDFVHGYVGSPYERGSGYPPVIADAGNGYLESIGSDWRFEDVSGADFDELQDLVEHGKPVLVWTTMGMADPEKTDIEFEGYEWYSNQHCVVFYDASDDVVKVMDTLDGLVERNRDDFVRIYDECGKMAVALV